MKKITFVLVLFMGIISNVNAQEKKLVSGNSIIYAIPQGQTSDIYNYGYGISANFDYNFSEHLVGRFDLGWNQFDGDNIAGFDLEKLNVWEFTGGIRGRISLFYAEILGGYYTGFDSWGYKPAVGIRWNKFDLQGSYNFAGDAEWVSLKLAYYWGR